MALRTCRKKQSASCLAPKELREQQSNCQLVKHNHKPTHTKSNPGEGKGNSPWEKHLTKKRVLIFLKIKFVQIVLLNFSFKLQSNCRGLKMTFCQDTFAFLSFPPQISHACFSQAWQALALGSRDSVRSSWLNEWLMETCVQKSKAGRKQEKHSVSVYWVWLNWIP